MSERLAALQRWVSEVLGSQPSSIEPASSDASFRRYFRVMHDGRSWIVMDAPPDKEDCEPFVRIAGAMHAVGLHVPVVHAEDHAQGFLLLDDLGTTSYLDVLNAQNVDDLYKDALAALLHLQNSDILKHLDLPAYDRTLLMQEMELFRDWYLHTHLGLTLDAATHQALDEAFVLLADNALSQPQVCVHRDYHSRNLMWLEDNNPGIIDFQDAVVGAVTYDLVSLLRDCYISWPRQQVEAWAIQHCGHLIDTGVLSARDRQHFLRWFDLMGVQRHLKASGIFARLNHRDGKPGYLDDIPRTLAYVREVARRYDELAGLAGILERLPVTSEGNA
jgi:aminoglycoside/choline kinase family phosphotransferase